MAQEERWTQQFEHVSQRVQQWQEANPKATLTEMQEALEAELNQLRTQMLTDLLHERAEEEAAEEVICPSCSTPMVRNGKRQRRLQDKDGVKVTLNRVQRRCQSCGLTIFPPG